MTAPGRSGLKRALLWLPGLMFCASAPAQDAGLSWLQGSWCLTDGARSVEEIWLPEIGGQMLGMSRTVKDGQVVGFEFMRIESTPEATRFIAQPAGAPATVFIASQMSDNRLELQNPGHDFPQKILYQREADHLTATISGPDEAGQEQSFSFSYHRCEH